MRQLTVSEGGVPASIADQYPESVFVANDIFFPALAVYMLVALGAYVCCFVLIQQRMPGTKLTKGLKYGISFAGLWFFGFVELPLFYDATFGRVLQSSLRDGVALIVCGVVASFFWGTDNSSAQPRPRQELMVIPIIAACFAIGHGIQYSLTFRAITLPHINAVHDPLDVAWLLMTGAWVGVMYYLLKPGLPFQSLFANTCLFAGVIFGVNWGFFNFFYNLFVDVPIPDLCVRVGLGLLSVFFGVFVYERFIDRKADERLFMEQLSTTQQEEHILREEIST
jgi:hypothetical protein